MNEIIRDKSRINKTGEVFTPDELVKVMVDTLPEELFLPENDKNFLDPACGDGQLIIGVLTKKLGMGYSPTDAVATTYGVDLMPDNVEVCKERIRSLIKKHTKKSTVSSTVEHKIEKNIVCHDSLDWDFDNWCSNADTSIAQYFMKTLKSDYTKVTTSDMDIELLINGYKITKNVSYTIKKNGRILFSLERNKLEGDLEKALDFINGE